MGRPHTTWPAALCPRLAIGDVLRCTGEETLAPRLIRARADEVGALVPVAILPMVADGLPEAVAVSLRETEYAGRIHGQWIAIRTTTDSRNRRRSRFVCPDCQGVADSLYLTPEASELTCRRCARVSYHWLPPPSGHDRPGWAREVEAALRACAELRGRARRRRTAGRGSGAGMDSERSREQAAAGNQALLTVRQRAVAHLWGQCGWSVVQLGELFGVSSRTIKRDLRVARVAKALPRRAKRSATDLAQSARGRSAFGGQARALLAACGRLRHTIGAAEDGVRSDAAVLWMAALQARLLGEERKLLVLIAGLHGANRVRVAQEDALPKYLDPDLLEAVTELAQAR